MTKCTGMRCPMQHGYKVDECNHTDCPYRTEPVTNADKIRAMSDEELAHWICKKMMSCSSNVCPGADLCQSGDGLANGLVKWLQQPAEG